MELKNEIESIIPSPMDDVIAKEEMIRSYGKKDILDEVRSIIRERGKEYGNSQITLGRIANLWNALLNNRDKLRHAITRDDVCKMMILMKIARMDHGYKRDSVVDIIGYAKLLEEVNED